MLRSGSVEKLEPGRQRALSGQGEEEMERAELDYGRRQRTFWPHIETLALTPDLTSDLNPLWFEHETRLTMW